MSYPLFPQRRKLRKWIFALPRVRQQIDQRAIGNRLAPQIDKRAIDKGIARKSPLVSSVPLSLHTRLSRFPYEATNDGDCIPYPASACGKSPGSARAQKFKDDKDFNDIKDAR